MTDREKAIVMAYTGISMLEGDKLNVFYRYLAELYGRPVYTHELIALDIEHKSKPDFLKLCDEEAPESKKGKWIPCSERLPDVRQWVLCQCRAGIMDVLRLTEDGSWNKNYPHTEYMSGFVKAWMPLPTAYQEEGD